MSQKCSLKKLGLGILV